MSKYFFSFSETEVNNILINNRNKHFVSFVLYTTKFWFKKEMTLGYNMCLP